MVEVQDAGLPADPTRLPLTGRPAAGGQVSASSRTCVRRKWLPDGSRNAESIP